MGKKLPKAKPAKKNAKPSGKAKPPRAEKRPPTPEQAERRRKQVMIGLTVAGLVALAVGATVGLDRLDARAARSMSAKPVQVAFEWPAIPRDEADPDSPATWLPAEHREHLESIVTTVLAPRSNDARDRGETALRAAPLAGVQDELFGSGWFEEPPALRREAGNTVRVEGVWRTPAAVVRTGGTDRVVDWSGRPMPFAVPTVAGAEVAMPLILGVPRGPATTQSGRVNYAVDWPSDSVPAAMSLLRLLVERGLIDQVEAIQTSDLERTGRLTIITDRATRIVWGVPPTAWSEVETRTATQKADLLVSYRERTGRIDANESRLEIFGPFTIADDSAGG